MWMRLLFNATEDEEGVRVLSLTPTYEGYHRTLCLLISFTAKNTNLLNINWHLSTWHYIKTFVHAPDKKCIDINYIECFSNKHYQASNVKKFMRISILYQLKLLCIYNQLNGNGVAENF